MDIGKIHVDSLKTSFGKRILNELLKLQWNISVTKLIDNKNISISSSTGLIRTRNEDRFAVCEIGAGSVNRYFLAVVCDGVGSTRDGDIAATLVIAALLEELASYVYSISLVRVAEEIVLKADYKVRQALKGSGLTTLSLILGRYGTNEIVVANVGDSRAYQWLPAAETIKQISVDDTFENEFRNAGMENAAVLDAHRLRGALSQSIGDVDRGNDSLIVKTYSFRNDGITGLVLATDGAWKSDEYGFKKILSNANSSHDAVRRVIAFSSWIGGVDNTSIIAIDNLEFLLDANWKFNYTEEDLSVSTIWSHDAKLIVACLPETNKKKKADYATKPKPVRVPRKAQSKSRSPEQQLELEEGTNTPSKSDITEFHISTKE